MAKKHKQDDLPGAFLFVLDVSLMTIGRRSAEIIIKNTTAYPFKLLDSALVCVYCCDKFTTGMQFREHMRTEHLDFNYRIAFAHLGQSMLKVECSDLRCRLCDSEFENIDDIAAHLVTEHGESYLNDNPLGVMPFKLDDVKFACAICDVKASCLRALNRHTASHFSYYSCDSCDATFCTPVARNLHIKLVHSLSSLQCRTCEEQFAFSEDLKGHYLENKQCCKYVCRVCGDRFHTWRAKQTHMEEVHGISAKKYTCLECKAVFESQDKLRVHFVIEHTNDYSQCVFCEEKFRTEAALQRHLVSHTGEKQFRCDVCGKAFFRSSTLTLHKWIHSDVKKYKCEICDKQFAQKVVWKKHVRKYHPDLIAEIED